MKTNTASITSLISSFSRGYHAQHDENVIFNDSLALSLLTDEEITRIKAYLLQGIDFFTGGEKRTFSDENDALTWIIQTQLLPTPLARSRYCEDIVLNTLETGTEQYVILGAGLDTFACRYAELQDKLAVFEVDYPATQQDKRERLTRAGITIPENIRFVPADFSVCNVKELLLNAGFDPNKKTIFSLLGVSYYITEESFINLTAVLFENAAKGSAIIFDYGSEALFSSLVQRVQHMIAMAAAGGEGMKTCWSYAQLEKLLENCGLLVYEHLSPQDIQQRFFDGRKDYLSAFEEINICMAEKFA